MRTANRLLYVSSGGVKAHSVEQVQEVQSLSLKVELLYYFIIVSGSHMIFIEFSVLDCTERCSDSLLSCIGSPTPTLCEAELEIPYMFFNLRLQNVFLIYSIAE
jgi:hypothetical protein